MDDDGFAVQSRRRRGTTREPARDRGRDSFLKEVRKYAGTDEDYDRAHARRYGREEGLEPDGKHHHGSTHFPHGSNRQKLHTHYSSSTRPRDLARTAYQNGLLAADAELDRMDEDERQYYRENTGGYAPHQHERLDPRAGAYRDNSYRNAENRRTFLESQPYGYHTAHDERKHHGYAENAYGEFEYAKERQQHHERHRSYSNLDPRRDRWGRPVSHR